MRTIDTFSYIIKYRETCSDDNGYAIRGYRAESHQLCIGEKNKSKLWREGCTWSSHMYNSLQREVSEPAPRGWQCKLQRKFLCTLWGKPALRGWYSVSSREKCVHTVLYYLQAQRLVSQLCGVTDPLPVDIRRHSESYISGISDCLLHSKENIYGRVGRLAEPKKCEWEFLSLLSVAILQTTVNLV